MHVSVFVCHRVESNRTHLTRFFDKSNQRKREREFTNTVITLYTNTLCCALFCFCIDTSLFIRSVKCCSWTKSHINHRKLNIYLLLGMNGNFCLWHKLKLALNNDVIWHVSRNKVALVLFNADNSFEKSRELKPM